jgi:hypothetical protein
VLALVFSLEALFPGLVIFVVVDAGVDGGLVTLAGADERCGLAEGGIGAGAGIAWGTVGVPGGGGCGAG